MPAQTIKKNFFFPDGAMVSIKRPQDGSYFDVGAINSAVTAALSWDENQVETANAGKTDKQIKNMTIAGGFTLINLDPEGVEKMGGGVFTRQITAATPTITVDDQLIASGFVDKGLNALVLIDSDVALRTTTEPTIASVTGAIDGLLVEDDDYTIVPDSNSASGYSIVFNLAGTSLTTVGQIITIDFNSVTPIASQKLVAGTSTAVLTAYAMKVSHTDRAGAVRELELFSVDPDSGGFTFGFKGANEEGLEEMPLTFTSKLDTTLTDGQQLMSWSVDQSLLS